MHPFRLLGGMLVVGLTLGSVQAQAPGGRPPPPDGQGWGRDRPAQAWGPRRAEPPPPPDQSGLPLRGPGAPPGPEGYTIEQAISDRAQVSTIAFEGVAFLTGNFAQATFLPPGKVADYFGFQYMRDRDAGGKGHNPAFLDRIAANVLRILNAEQRALLLAEAEEEVPLLEDLALRRLPLIRGFYRHLNGETPPGSGGLNRQAVAKATGALFAADAGLAYQRAETLGRIANSLSAEQKGLLRHLRFADFNAWPALDMELYKLPRGTAPLVNIAYMSMAGDFFSWYAGNIEADLYFAPERHGTYFGGFYMKDMPVMGKRDADISTALTGDVGEQFLRSLPPEVQRLYVEVLDAQRPILNEIIAVRRSIGTELRRMLERHHTDRSKVERLGQRYGELDGNLAWLYANVFSRTARALTTDQRRALTRLRGAALETPTAAAYLFAEPLDRLPEVGNGEALFFTPE